MVQYDVILYIEEHTSMGVYCEDLGEIDHVV